MHHVVTSSNVTVTFHLYGPVSPERMEEEMRLVNYRAEQLAFIGRRPEPLPRWQREEM